MRIVKMDNHSEWPLIVKCARPSCPAHIELSMPSDMQRTCFRGHPPEFAAYATCPICAMEHKLERSQIPEEIFNQIPTDNSTGIMSYHD